MNLWNCRYIFVIFIFFSSCSSSKKLLDTQEEDYKYRPEWVKQRPVSNEFYIGIGMVSKQAFPMDYMKRAKNQAIADIASEISVKLNSQSTLNTLDYGDEFFEQYNSNIKITAQGDLEDYEIVDSYQNDYKYWVFYRINKKKYYERQKQKREKAIKISKNFFSQALDDQKNNNYNEALINYLKAMDAIKLFFSDLLEMDLNGKKIIYNKELITKFKNLIRKITVKPLNKVVRVKNGYSIGKDKLTFRISPPTKGLAFLFAYSGGIIKNHRAISNYQGLIYTNIDEVSNKRKNLELTTIMDFDYIFQQADVDYIFKKLFDNVQLPKAKIKIIVSNPNLYINFKDKDDYINESIKNFISKQNRIDIVDNIKQADFILDIYFKDYNSSKKMFFLINDIKKGSKKQTFIETQLENYSELILREYELRINDWVIENIL